MDSRNLNRTSSDKKLHDISIGEDSASSSISKGLSDRTMSKGDERNLQELKLMKEEVEARHADQTSSIQARLRDILSNDSEPLVSELFTPARNQDFFELVNKIKDIVDNPPQSLSVVGKKKLEQMRFVVLTSLDMEKDNWKGSYAEGLMKKYLLLDNVIGDKFPSALKPKSVAKGQYVDKKGKLFDSLRGPGSPMDLAKTVIEENNGDIGLIKEYSVWQKGSSWSSGSVALKLFIAEKGRKEPPGDYFWGVSHDYQTRKSGYVNSLLENPKFGDSMQFMHVLSLLFVSKVELPGSDLSKREITLHRSENGTKSEVQNRRRGVAESYALSEANPAFGKYYFSLKIKHHNVFAPYIPSFQNESFFLDNVEKEFVVFSNESPSKVKKFSFFDHVSASYGKLFS